MNSVEQNIYNIANETVEENDFFIVEFVLRGNPNNRIIELYIDSEKNVTAEDLAGISRLINKKFEEQNIIDSQYRLDVSSPGTDKPLKFLKQFPKNVNRKFEVSYFTDEGTKKFTGKLIRVEGDNVVFLFNQNEIIISFNNIKKAKVIVSFS
jgi:ribosome maturation factor RimP